MSVFCLLRIWYPWEHFTMFIGLCLLLLRMISTDKCTVLLEKHLRIIAFLTYTYINLQCGRNLVESKLKNYLVIKINDQTWLKSWLIALVTTISTCSIWGNIYFYVSYVFSREGILYQSIPFALHYNSTKLCKVWSNFL